MFILSSPYSMHERLYYGRSWRAGPGYRAARENLKNPNHQYSDKIFLAYKYKFIYYTVYKSTTFQFAKKSVKQSRISEVIMSFKNTTNFVHLHVHSNYSLCRGANTIEQICKTAKEMGMSHMALTDTNGVYGMVWFLEMAESYGLTPIIGVELKTDKHHCVMLAKNGQGYQCLCRAISRLHVKDEFDLPDFLIGERHDVVILTNQLKLLSELVQKDSLQDVYAELIPYDNREEVLGFARRHGIPVAASNSVYFIEPKDWDIHQLLRAIDLNTTCERIPADEIAPRQACFRSKEQMQHEFPDCPEAIINTQNIANECSFNLRSDRFIFPSYKGPQGEDAHTFLEKRVIQGVTWRYGQMNSSIRQRMDYELGIIREKKFAPYFLVVADIVNKAPRTCGRGSAAASLVSYCLGITHVDPIKYDLFFERFLNPGRKDPPDIDVDFPWDERDDILDYIFKKYGFGYTAMISNHNCFKARSAVREIAKVYGLPDNEISEVTKKITSYWQPQDIWKLTQSHPKFKNTELLPPWPEIIEKAEKIRGYPRHLSVHCGGVVIAPDGLDRYVPFQPAKKVLKLTDRLADGSSGIPRSNGNGNTVQVVQWEKDQAEEMGLIKMDILGNRSLAVIRDALAAVKANYGIEIDYQKWNPLDDKKTLEYMARGDTIGVFYVESPAMRLLQQKTGKGDFEHLVIHSSIIRPAVNEYINEYVRRLKGGAYDPIHPIVEDLLKETYGIMVYQEDVSKVAMALADFDAAEADDLRKIMTKKHKKRQLQDYQRKFYLGGQSKGVSLETCEKIWDMIMSFSGYSFCKPHSASYALVSFKSAFLRAHYPAEFIASVISNQGGYYSTFAYISEARRMGLNILMPDINKSQQCYFGKNQDVRIGLMQLKGLSNKSLQVILVNREKDGPFTSFDDFLTRITIDPSDITILIKAGCFDELEPGRSRPELLWRLEWRVAQRQQSRHEMSLSLFEDNKPQQNVLPKPDNYDEKTILQHEVDTLGFLLSRHPLALYKERLSKLDYVKGKDLYRHVGKKVKTVGWLITHKVVSTRKKELMEFMSFEDTTAIYETVFFPKAFAEFVHMITSTRPYILSGKVDSQYGAVTLTVDKVALL